jgi:hypothetical protein
MSLSEHPYVRAAIDGEVGNLASAVEGIRNQTLFKSTANLASLGLREGEILHHLKPAAEQIGLRGSEFYTTVKSGVRSGSSRPRQIPDIVRRASPNASASPPHPQPETSNAAGVQGDEPTLIFIADIEGPPVWADEMRRHIYRQDSLPVQIKIKRASGRYVNWYSVIRDGRTGWQPAKPEGYIACPYIGAVDPFDPGLADRLLYWPEGEKDCDTLGRAGLPAFTFGGTGDGLPNGILDFLRDRYLVILADISSTP